jgi:hypothetical protein
MLQIIDVASNNFTGNLPIVLLSTWMAVMDHAHEAKTKLNHIHVQIGTFYYQDKVTVISKGLEVELVKILIIFTTNDFSCNNFDGPIPEEIGEFTLLYILNLSHNAFMGQIPSSLGKLSNLKSLDLSSNMLTGEIPMQLANGLIFLSVLNLSFNQLVGHIPFIKQISTFSENSFKGNERLCGLPLKSQCSHEEPRLSPPMYEESNRSMIKWNYISAELGFVFGFGIVMGPLMFWKSGGYGITNMLMTFFSRSSLNCILEMNIVEDQHSTISSRDTSCSYDQRQHLQVCHENLLLFYFQYKSK